MKTTFYRNLKAFTLCAGFFSLVACKEKGVTQAGLIPPVDNIHTFSLTESFFTPVVNVGQYDSLFTNDYLYPYAALGRMSDDPFFGTSEAGLYIQFVPQAGFTKFPAGTIIDSATICLPYVPDVRYGDSVKSAPNFQYLKVFRVTDDNFKKADDLKFYAFTDFTTQLSPVLGFGAFDYKNVKDTITSPVDTFGGQMRIRMSNDFVNEIATADSSKFANAAAFQAFFKGFYIAPFDTTAVQRRFSYITLNGTNIRTTARLEFHTHNASNQYGKISFPFNSSNCAFSNRIKRNYTGKPAATFVNSTANRDSMVIQGYPGHYSEITIKNIDQIPPSVINKARLLITRIPVGMDNIYYAPAQLVPVGVANGLPYTIADLLTNGGGSAADGFAFVRGKPMEVTINGTKYVQYELNFPRELQVAINAGKKELKIRISSATANPGAYRMVAGGPASSDDTKLRLEVIYTKIN